MPRSLIISVNPFMPNGFSHLYQLDEFITNLGILSVFFVFIQILIEHSVSKQ